jgi:DNA-binding transcriptional LysR family regulator
VGESVSIAVGGPLVFDDDALMLGAARDGAGLAYVYAADAHADIAAGRLVCVLQHCLPPPSRYFLYYPSRRQMPAVLRAFVDLLRTPA